MLPTVQESCLSGPSEPRADAAPPEATETLYRALLRAALDPTVAIDATGTVVTASESVRRVFGWSPDQLVGRDVSVLMPEPHRSEHGGYLERYLRTGQTTILGRTREFEVRHKDGHTLPCELSVARADTPGGAGPLFIGTFRDVSERKRSERAREESERRFRAIFEQSFQYIGLLDPRGVLLEANQAALDGAGVSREEVIGRPFWETRWWTVSEESRTRLKEGIREAAAGRFVRFETEHRGPGDKILAMDFSLKPVCNAEGEVVLLIPEGRDISELKRAQRAETAMLRALATIGESAAMLAHEIKNPITAVNLALKAVAHQLGEDQQAVLEDLAGRMRRLERIMRRTLTFTRPIELKPEAVEIGALLRQVAEQLHAEAARRGAQIECEPGEGVLEVSGDLQLLDEVLTNVVQNALEALGAGGRVRLWAKADDDAVRIVVEDGGPGISAELMGKLFTPFATSKSGGTGLGLAFCKKVAEAHGGTIEAGASPLGGARFTLRLPSIQRGSPHARD